MELFIAHWVVLRVLNLLVELVVQKLKVRKLKGSSDLRDIKFERNFRHIYLRLCGFSF